jgi:hypothetical protein
MQDLKIMMKSLFEQMGTTTNHLIALRKANGLPQHMRKLKTFSTNHNIGVMLIFRHTSMKRAT